MAHVFIPNSSAEVNCNYGQVIFTLDAIERFTPKVVACDYLDQNLDDRFSGGDSSAGTDGDSFTVDGC